MSEPYDFQEGDHVTIVYLDMTIVTGTLKVIYMGVPEVWLVASDSGQVYRIDTGNPNIKFIWKIGYK